MNGDYIVINTGPSARAWWEAAKAAMPTIPPIPKTPDGYKQYAAAMAQEFHAQTTGVCKCGCCDRGDDRDPLGAFSDKPVREGWFQIVEAR